MSRFLGRSLWAVIAVAGRVLDGLRSRKPRRTCKQHLAGDRLGLHVSGRIPLLRQFCRGQSHGARRPPGDPSRALARRTRLRTHQQMDRIRPPFRGDCWPGSAGGTRSLAAQFGYLPGFLWIVIGAVLGGAVQDFVVLFCSMRRDGKSLGQMAREEIGKVGGFTALITVLLIMIILLAVIGLVVVNALPQEAVWGLSPSPPTCLWRC